jgi:hypothetical protein
MPSLQHEWLQLWSWLLLDCESWWWFRLRDVWFWIESYRGQSNHVGCNH